MGDFFAELRRRHIYRIGAGYVVVAWGVAQLIDFLSQVFALPAWIAQPVAIVLAIGFPITLIVAWLIEGKAHEAVASAVRSKATTVDWLLFGAVAVLIALTGYQQVTPRNVIVAAVDEMAEDISDRLPNSIAVLPFANLSPDPDNAYFAAGIHDTLLNELAKISDMNVISRTSVLRYEDAQTPISQIAAELNVETVMEGTVQYADGQVRITAQLIDPETGAHLWSENYDRDFSGIFAIQTEIASNIAMALEAELLPAELASIERVPTASTEAYELYLQAITSVPDIAPLMPDADVVTLHRYLDRVIDADPGFAEAYALKGFEYAFSTSRTFALQEGDVRSQREALAREYIDRALSLDPDSGTAYAALGVLNLISRRGTEAQEAFEHARQLQPNNLNVLVSSSIFNAVWGRRDEADRLMRRALELSPDSFDVLLPASYVYLLTKDYDLAAESIRAAIEITPNFPSVYASLGRVETARGNEVEALDALQFSEQLNRDARAPDRLAIIAYSYGLLGREDDAMRVFADIENVATTYYVGPRTWAAAYLSVGDYDQALAALEEVVASQGPDEGYSVLHIIAVNALGDPVLDRPEFAEVRARLYTGL
jgi:TolB-like protein/Tfp pilus assembly protein PilF